MVSEQEQLRLPYQPGAKEASAVVRSRLRIHRLLGNTFIHFMKNHLPSSAAAISYFVMLALFPIMLLLIDLGNRFPRIADIKNYALETLVLMVPQGAQETLVEYLLGVAHPSKGETITCVVVILWAASWAFTIIEQAINRIWRTSCRSFLHGRLVSLLMVIGIGGLLVLSAIATAALVFIHSEANRFTRSLPTGNLQMSGALWSIVFGVVGLMLTISFFALVYKVMPNTRVTVWEALPGAIIAGVSWEGAKYAFAWFLAEVPYEGLYGSLAAVLAALTWIYISNLLMLFGAQMTALLHCDYLTGQCASQTPPHAPVRTMRAPVPH
ncbi:MAG: YihY/virulence factor BrkB family protein [Acidobacteria bacterium]|nr:YihY/virulence factor BrkB family protein [Acidobacteriota bacterium]